MADIKERLFEYLEAKQLKPFTFERQCKLGNGFCKRINDNISDGSLLLIEKGAPDLNVNWLKTGFGEMLKETQDLGNPNSDDGGSHMVAMVRMMQEFIEVGKKNSDANLLNAEANKMNARNLERLIGILERKLLDE